MAKIKKTLKKIGRYTWELFKSSIPAALMYFCAGAVLMMLTMKDVENLQWDNNALMWTLICGIAACAYNGLVMWANGGNQYEMLVSGNVKRTSMDEYGMGYKMSNHKEAKEYRVWKGFAIGGFAAIYTIIFAIVFGCNQSAIDTQQLSGGALSVFVLIGMFLSGWTILPFYYANLNGAAVSYFLTALFALLPIVISGVFYIIGAYARRNKAIRQQELADKAAKAEAEKVKKINYGGLPGTKPKKRK